ncbi:MAG: TraR/DksA family transcriptional regulator, partial [Thermodesulfobacteriota bacterium]
IQEEKRMRDDIDLEFFKKALEDRLAAIQRDAEGRDTGPVELDQTRIGRLTRMDAMRQQAMSQAAARLTEQERLRILSALDRMKSGDYGRCIVCDEDIEEGRLRFDPGIPTCIACARRAENG